LCTEKTRYKPELVHHPLAVLSPYLQTQESIPILAESIPGLHKRLQIRALFSEHYIFCRTVQQLGALTTELRRTLIF
jgi:hypothetical protein